MEIPKRYENATLSDFSPSIVSPLTHALKQFKSCSQDCPPFILIDGIIGSGKTHLSYSICKYIEGWKDPENFSVSLSPISEVSLLSWFSVDRSFLEDVFKKSQILIVEDIDLIFSVNEYAQDVLPDFFLDILKFRKVYGCLTIFTSSLTREHLLLSSLKKKHLKLFEELFFHSNLLLSLPRVDRRA